MILVRTCQSLLEHLVSHEHDGTTVALSLFSDGRLMYPGRRDVEEQMGAEDPYTLEHEARIVVGLGRRTEAAIRMLAREASARHTGHDPTLDLLWSAHVSAPSSEGISLDRVVAALVAVQELSEGNWNDPDVIEAAVVMIDGLRSAGFPPSRSGLEELFDGADPAVCGLGMVML